MHIHEVRERTPQLLDRLLAVWEASVRATHRFLSDAEIERIKTMSRRRCAAPRT